MVARFEAEPALGELAGAPQHRGGGDGEVVEVHHAALLLERLVLRFDRLEQLPDGGEGAFVERIQRVEVEAREDRLEAGIGVQHVLAELLDVLGLGGHFGFQPRHQGLPVERVAGAGLLLEPERELHRNRDGSRVPGDEALGVRLRRTHPVPENRAGPRAALGQLRGAGLEPRPPGQPVVHVAGGDGRQIEWTPAEQRQFGQYPAVVAGRAGEDPVHRLLPDDRHLAFVENFHSRRDTGVERELPDEPEVEGVERGDRHVREVWVGRGPPRAASGGSVGSGGELRVAEALDDPALHLRRRLAGEGERQDVAGGDPLPDEVQVAVGEHRRLAGAGGGAEHDAALRVRRSVAGALVGRTKAALPTGSFPGGLSKGRGRRRGGVEGSGGHSASFGLGCLRCARFRLF